MVEEEEDMAESGRGRGRQSGTWYRKRKARLKMVEEEEDMAESGRGRGRQSGMWYR